MQKYPIYAMVLVIGIVLIRLIGSTVFDKSRYSEIKKNNFSNILAPPEKKEKKKKEITSNPTYHTTQRDTSMWIPSQTEKNSNYDDSIKNVPIDPPVKKKFRKENNSFSELKNNYLAPKIANLPSGQLRKDITIRYYRHEKDKNKVYVLKKLGYYIHEKKSTETIGNSSNIIYYGDNVDIKDIQIIAYTMIQKNIPLKAIKPTRFKWKSTSLEIGTDTLLFKEKTLTEDDINDFKK